MDNKDNSFTISRLVEQLKDEFPQLSVSKVRFLESSGLLNPVRTKSGYRVYSNDDLQRLRMILTIQETHYYPLQVIKSMLEKYDEGNVVPELEGLHSSESELDFLSTTHTVDDIASKAHTNSELMYELDREGLIEITSTNDNQKIVSGSDYPIISAAARLIELGFDMRFLKMHLQRANRDTPFYRQALGIASKLDEHCKDDPDAFIERVLDLNATLEKNLVKKMLSQS